MEYTALSIPRREIRLLTLFRPSPSSAQVGCEVHVVSLQDSPRYEALSYVWGDPQLTEPIKVNGHQVQVTLNLAYALKQLQHASDTVELWVDALCINQNDVIEKNHQLPLMGEIYSKASQVIVWLGPQKDDSDLAMDLIQDLGERTIDDDELRVFWAMRSDWKHGIESWKAVALLFERPWWFRIWTHQELVLGRRVCVVCGSKRVPWAYFHLATKAMLAHVNNPTKTLLRQNILDVMSEIDCKCVSLRQEHRTRLRSPGLPYRGNGLMALDFLLLETSPFEATDPRDKIYGLLGLVKDSEALLTPDYRKPVADIYREVAYSMMKASGRLMGLRMTGIGIGMENTVYGLPSWVHDWTCTPVFEVLAFPLVSTKYHASGDYKAVLNLSEDGYVLLGQGFEVDTLCDSEADNYRHESAGSNLSSKWESMADLESLDDDSGKKYYPSGISRLQAYFRTLVADVDECGDRLGGFRAARSLEERVSEYLNNKEFRSNYWDDPESKIHPNYLTIKAPHGFYFADLDKNGNIIKRPEQEEASKYETFLKAFLIWSGRSEWRNLSDMELYGARPADPLIQPDNPPMSNQGRKARLMRPFTEALERATNNRLFFLTEKGYMGLAPLGAQKGDIVCVLCGSEVPLLLRCYGDEYVLVGECFVQGLMDGEIIDEFKKGKISMKTFAIS